MKVIAVVSHVVPATEKEMEESELIRLFKGRLERVGKLEETGDLFRVWLEEFEQSKLERVEISIGKTGGVHLTIRSENGDLHINTDDHGNLFIERRKSAFQHDYLANGQWKPKPPQETGYGTTLMLPPPLDAMRVNIKDPFGPVY